MDWKRLQTMRCPSCAGKLEDAGMGYRCKSCEFFVGYEKFQKLINDMMMPKKVLYDPDKVDRSDWQ